MGGKARKQLLISAVLLLGALALFQRWIAARRPDFSVLQANQTFIVTSDADRGPGTLREAIFAADSAPARARIVLRTDRIDLDSPLPPLVNSLGVILSGETNPAKIDAHKVVSGPVLDVDAPNSAITGIEIANASAEAVMVRKSGFAFFNSSLKGCDTGIYVANGVQNLIAEGSAFDGNRVSIQMAGDNSSIVIRNDHFSHSKEASIWAVQKDAIATAGTASNRVEGNSFEEDRLSIVSGNFSVLVQANEFVGAREAALYLFGAGAAVRDNRIRNGAGTGILAQGTQGAVIEANEIDHNGALAVLVQSSGDAVVRSNRVYDNGYGIGFVLGERDHPNLAAENMLLHQQFDGIILIGDSPLIQRNRVSANSLAAVRILDLIPQSGGRVPSNPFLENNVMEGNKLNDPVRGEYYVIAPGAKR